MNGSTEAEQRFVLAHELEPSVPTQERNALFMDSRTHFNTDNYEAGSRHLRDGASGSETLWIFEHPRSDDQAAGPSDRIRRKIT